MRQLPARRVKRAAERPLAAGEGEAGDGKVGDRVLERGGGGAPRPVAGLEDVRDHVHVVARGACSRAAGTPTGPRARCSRRWPYDTDGRRRGPSPAAPRGRRSRAPPARRWTRASARPGRRPSRWSAGWRRASGAGSRSRRASASIEVATSAARPGNSIAMSWVWLRYTSQPEMSAYFTKPRARCTRPSMPGSARRGPRRRSARAARGRARWRTRAGRVRRPPRTRTRPSARAQVRCAPARTAAKLRARLSARLARAPATLTNEIPTRASTLRPREPKSRSRRRPPGRTRFACPPAGPARSRSHGPRRAG